MTGLSGGGKEAETDFSRIPEFSRQVPPLTFPLFTRNYYIYEAISTRKKSLEEFRHPSCMVNFVRNGITAGFYRETSSRIQVGSRLCNTRQNELVRSNTGRNFSSGCFLAGSAKGKIQHETSKCFARRAGAFSNLLLPTDKPDHFLANLLSPLTGKEGADSRTGAASHRQIPFYLSRRSERDSGNSSQIREIN